MGVNLGRPSFSFQSEVTPECHSIIITVIDIGTFGCPVFAKYLNIPCMEVQSQDASLEKDFI